jgi:hypothetical protein
MRERTFEEIVASVTGKPMEGSASSAFNLAVVCGYKQGYEDSQGDSKPSFRRADAFDTLREILFRSTRDYDCGNDLGA